MLQDATTSRVFNPETLFYFHLETLHEIESIQYSKILHPVSLTLHILNFTTTNMSPNIPS